MTRSHGFEATVPGFARRDLLRASMLAGLAVTSGLGRYMFQATEVYAAPAPGTFVAAPLASQLAWLLGAVNGGGAALTEAEVSEHVAPALLAQMPAAQIIGLVRALAEGYSALTLQGTTRPSTATQAVGLVSTSAGIQIALPMAIEADAPYRITGVTVYPSPSGDGVPLQPEHDGATAPLIDIGGRELYAADIGNGGPTVVLEAGLGDSAATWAGVIPAIAGFTRVISYDRPNSIAGASDHAPMPRTAADVVVELNALLANAKIPGPYVLVGHSVGGIFSRLYASTYPAEVAGLVLVDASHEDQDVRREAMVSPELFAAEQASIGANPEGVDLEASFVQMREARAATPMPAIPLVLLSAGLGDSAMFPAGWPMEAEARLHDELQADLAGLVPGGRRVIAEQSGHYIQQSRPDLIVSAIRDVMHAVIDPTSWAATGN